MFWRKNNQNKFTCTRKCSILAFKDGAGIETNDRLFRGQSRHCDLLGILWLNTDSITNEICWQVQWRNHGKQHLP